MYFCTKIYYMESSNKFKNYDFKPFKSIYLIGVALISIYMLCQIFPPLWVLDSTTLKHFFFAILNVFSIAFLIYYISKSGNYIPNSMFKNKISYAWLFLLFMMILSFFQSMNISESIVTINRWVIVYLMFIYFSIFLDKKPSIINTLVNLAIIISIINILWCIIGYYYVGAYINPRKNLMINGFYGNKNIFAAAILFKLPFLYYAFFFRKNIIKWLSLFLVFGLTLCLVILSARTSFLGLILQLILLGVYTLFLFFRFKKSKKILVISTTLIFSALLGFFSGDAFIKYNFKHYSDKGNVAKIYNLTEDSYSVSNRFKSIEDGNSKGRLKIWKNTFTIIKEKPWLGYGLGNHKLAIMKIEAPQKFNYVVSDHAHNDFLEMWSELGIFGLISYLLLFVSGFFLFIKTQWEKNIPNTTRFVSFAGILCVITYMNDAMFNFPLERADCQLYLALGMAMILYPYLKVIKKNNSPATKKYVIYIIAFFTIGIVTIETLHFYSSVLQKEKILQVNGDKSIRYSAEQWESMFPPIPNIDENASPIALTIATRYDKEKNWRKAIDITINDKSNPYLALREYRLSNYYFKFNMLDSAEYWARRCMMMKPLCYEPVKILFRKYTNIERYDIADTILTNFISKYQFTIDAWIDLVTTKQKLHRCSEAIIILDSALYYFPQDKRLQDLRGAICY